MKITGQLGLDNCHENADCLDTLGSYICVCKPGFIDLNFLRNPGRLCVQSKDVYNGQVP